MNHLFYSLPSTTQAVGGPGTLTLIQLVACMQTCLQCEGVIFFTGVGKSGFIAQKISQTFVSTGSKAVYLNPTDALHGDLGIVSQKDMVVCFSKSGDTDELLRLVPYAKVRPPWSNLR